MPAIIFMWPLRLENIFVAILLKIKIIFFWFVCYKNVYIPYLLNRAIFTRLAVSVRDFMDKYFLRNTTV